MRLPYRLRSVDLLAGVENDAEFWLLSIPPASSPPCATLMSPWSSPSPSWNICWGVMDRRRWRQGRTIRTLPCQQFLHLGEAGLAASCISFPALATSRPQNGRNSWSARQALDVFETRLTLVTRRLAKTPYQPAPLSPLPIFPCPMPCRWPTGMWASRWAQRNRPTGPLPVVARAISALWMPVRHAQLVGQRGLERNPSPARAASQPSAPPYGRNSCG